MPKQTAETALARLLAVMARLRHPEKGCPWDRDQTFATIAPYTIEEAYEVAEAIAQDDMAALREELGDLLFQVVFHARMAEERGAFDFAAVAEGLADKMERRHPHVFGEARIDDAAAQTVAWEEMKAAERAAKTEGKAASVLDGVPLALPALTRAVKLSRRAAKVGFEWDRADQILDKIAEEVEELRAELRAGDAARAAAELGDILFGWANLARRLEVDPERALAGTNRKFERRFRRMEDWLAAEGKTMAEEKLDDLEALWVKAKGEEGKP
ncbi:MAG: nucleoside triphosphate pyrophosphohydrolase [Alphaproteobacteria bacterium]|nr:nucleoside triphosphate pyrophosphohydrolase [Alphaproteobacteria bacterium]